MDIFYFVICWSLLAPGIYHKMIIQLLWHTNFEQIYQNMRLNKWRIHFVKNLEKQNSELHLLLLWHTTMWTLEVASSVYTTLRDVFWYHKGISTYPCSIWAFGIEMEMELSCKILLKHHCRRVCHLFLFINWVQSVNHLGKA